MNNGPHSNSQDVDIIPFYRDLLLRTTPSNSASVSNCVLKGWFHHLGNMLGFDSMRIFLLQDDLGRYVQHQIFGDNQYWKGFDIARVRKERTVYKNLFFVKIKHIREDGSIIVLGYLSFHTQDYVSAKLLDKLDVLCMLYGNYVVKRVIHGRMQRIEANLDRAYKIAMSKDLPGTKVIRLIETLQRLSGFNKGFFCTVCDNTIIPEYVSSNNGTTYLRKRPIWKWGKDLMDRLNTSYIKNRCFLSDFPEDFIRFTVYQDTRPINDFEVSIYPIYVDEELISMWLFVTSKDNPFDRFDNRNLLDNLYPLLVDTYKFLFQRRYNKMVVNPIFQNRDTRTDENSVFIIMPFTESWSNDIWEQVIKPSVKELNMTPVRADDLYGANIMEDVWQSILKAAIIICDTTGRNPNVFYELGIAHTIGKKVVLLTQKIEDIPFDLQAYRHIKYDITLSGGNQLKESLKKHITELLK